MILSTAACSAERDAARFFAGYDGITILFIAVVVLCAWAICEMAEFADKRGLKLRGTAITWYFNGFCSPMLMGQIASWLFAPHLVHQMAGPTDAMHSLVAGAAIAWAIVNVVRILRDPHPAFQGPPLKLFPTARR